MTEIEELIRQAEAFKAMKREVKRPIPSSYTWQELLDGKPYPNLNVKNL